MMFGALPAEGAARPASSPRAWKGRAAILASLIAITAVPVVLAAFRTPAGTVFTGYVVIARDAFVYQALWRAGWNGAWLFHPLYSSEPQPGILIYAWYLWTGHLVGFMAGPWLYHAARIGAGAALLAAVWRLAGCLFPLRVQRGWATILAVLGGGVGVFLPNGLQVGALHTVPTESLVSGIAVSDILSMAPHLAWGAALMCWIFSAALLWTRWNRRLDLLGGVAASVGLALMYPQLVVLALTSVGAWALRSRSRAGILFAAAGAAGVAPYLGYLAWADAHFPGAFIGIGATAQVPFHFDVGDPVGFLLLSHMVATLLILVAGVTRRIKGDLVLPLLWIVVMTGLMFLPGLRTVFGRSYLASSVPFGLVGAAGIPVVLGWVRDRAWRRRVLALMLGLSSLFGVYSLAHPIWIGALRLDPRGEYESAGEAAALQWLAPRSTSADIVLTTYLDGVFVPAQTNARAYVGHPDQTLRVAEKSDQAVAFFTRWAPAERDAFLAAQSITYVLATNPHDAARLGPDPRLQEVEQGAGATLFKVAG